MMWCDSPRRVRTVETWQSRPLPHVICLREMSTKNHPSTDQRQHLDLLMQKCDITAATLAVQCMRNLVSFCSQAPRRLAATCAEAVE